MICLLKEETTSLAIIILDEAEAQEQLHGVGGGKGESLYRCTRKSLSLGVNFNGVRHTEAGGHQFNVCMALHLAWMPRVDTGPCETFFSGPQQGWTS